MIFCFVSTLMVWFVHMCLCVCIHTYTHVYICVCVCQQFRSSCVSSSISPKFYMCVCVYSIFVCVCLAVVGLLLCVGFLSLQSAGATLCCSVWSSHCSGFWCWGAQALGTWAALVAAWGCSSCSSWALECGLSSCGTQVTVVLWHVGSS